MPTLKTNIFNLSIDLNYEAKDKDKLLKLINNLNARFEKYNNLSGQVSDKKIMILTALQIEDNLLDQKKLMETASNTSKELNMKNQNIAKLSDEIIALKDKINLLESNIQQKQNAESLIEHKIDEINSEIADLNKSMLSIYEE
tara:strand:+ start:396 stop:824 length:429 start_codon:yes stop_codon:yes gene_type:complete